MSSDPFFSDPFSAPFQEPAGNAPLSREEEEEARKRAIKKRKAEIGIATDSAAASSREAREKQAGQLGRDSLSLLGGGNAETRAADLAAVSLLPDVERDRIIESRLELELKRSRSLKNAGRNQGSVLSGNFGQRTILG